MIVFCSILTFKATFCDIVKAIYMPYLQTIEITHFLLMNNDKRLSLLIKLKFVSFHTVVFTMQFNKFIIFEKSLSFLIITVYSTNNQIKRGCKKQIYHFSHPFSFSVFYYLHIRQSQILQFELICCLYLHIALFQIFQHSLIIRLAETFHTFIIKCKTYITVFRTA